MSKTALRARVRTVRDAFAPTAAIIAPPAFLATLSSDLVVASYVPVGAEADPAPLARAATAAGCRLALPHVTVRDRPMRFLAWVEGDALMPGPFGLSQPAHDAPQLTPDLVLAPMLAFDRRGNRLGQGAGYYDRAFAAHPAAWRVGVAWSVQEVDVLAPDPWDVPLHAIATELEWIEP